MDVFSFRRNELESTRIRVGLAAESQRGAEVAETKRRPENPRRAGLAGYRPGHLYVAVAR